MRILLCLPVPLVLAACPPDTPGDDGGDPPQDVDIGVIVLEQTRTPSWEARATFGTPVESACTVEEIAGCTVTTCEADNEPAAPVDTAHLDAGAITIESEAKSVTLVRGDDGQYGLERVDGEEFFQNGGELFAEATGGADLEGFTLTARAPTPLQMVTPPLASVTVKVTDPLPLEWSNTSQGDLRVVLGNNIGTVGVTCFAPAASGAFEIPAEIVGRFPLGEGSMSIRGEVRATANLANARHVDFIATTPSTSAVGNDANYFVTFAAP